MAEWVSAGRLDELTDGAMKVVEARDRQLLLARVGGNVYVTNNRCPHLAGNLSRGKLEGTVITCPRHHSRFDLRDGRVIRWTDWPAWLLFFARIIRSPRPLKTYPVKLEADNIMVEL